MKEIIDKLDFIKIRNFCSAKDNVKRMRRQATDQEKYLQKTHLIKGLLPKILKKSLKTQQYKKKIPSRTRKQTAQGKDKKGIRIGKK